VSGERVQLFSGGLLMVGSDVGQVHQGDLKLQRLLQNFDLWFLRFFLRFLFFFLLVCAGLLFLLLVLLRTLFGLGVAGFCVLAVGLFFVWK
jgi:hypothetical protein